MILFYSNNYFFIQRVVLLRPDTPESMRVDVLHRYFVWT